MSTDANRDRRAFLRSGFGALGVLGAVAVTGAGLGSGALRPRGAGPFGAATAGASGLERIDGPARLTGYAERLGVPPPVIEDPGPARVVFPLDPRADSYVLDNYGDCRGSRAHIGTDIVSERGASVYAAATGELTAQYLDTGTAGFGWQLTADDGRRFRYFHLDAFEPGLALGDRVRFGQVLGGVGSSGNFTWVNGERVEDRTNIHLHFEVYRAGGGSVDPLDLMAVPAGIGVGPPRKGCSHLVGRSLTGADIGADGVLDPGVLDGPLD